ncbi:MAG TPA: alpha/beta fold hydrolase, partial [Acidimicrobiales bacterium]
MRHAFAIDVSSVAPAGVRQCRGEVFVDVARRDVFPIVLCCVPGGGMSRRYFDLDVPAHLGEHSMARALARQGFVVVTIDHPGVGESDTPDDGYELTPQRVADVNAHVVHEVRRRLHAGDLAPGLEPITTRASIGVGHSAGAVVTIHQQARHRSHDALALLGFGGRGL